MDEFEPHYDKFEEMIEMLDDLSQDTNRHKLSYVVLSAITKCFEELDSNELKLILYSMVYTHNRMGLTPLNLANFYVYMLTPMGDFRRIRTKAWDTSRKKVYGVTAFLRKKIISEYHKYKDTTAMNMGWDGE